jgi:ribosome-associated protein
LTQEHTLSNDPTETNARDWSLLAARAADDKLGLDTVVIDVGDVLAVTDAFVITTGSGPRQVKAIVDEVERRIAESGGPRPLRVEGLQALEWALLDYGPFVVHVFDAEQRDFYQLDRLWGDRPRLDWKLPIPDRV